MSLLTVTLLSCHVYSTWCVSLLRFATGSVEFVCVWWKIWACALSFPAGIVESDDINVLIEEMETAANYCQKVRSEKSVCDAFLVWPVPDLSPQCLNHSWKKTSLKLICKELAVVDVPQRTGWAVLNKTSISQKSMLWIANSIFHVFHAVFWVSGLSDPEELQ